MDPGDRLRKGKQLAREGRYREALGEYIWFHEHALEHEPAYYGVRLSFALYDWIDLAQYYPKALAALKDIRDRKTETLLAGEGDRELFRDVESINRHLQDERNTYELFLRLRDEFPSLASSCAPDAITSMVQSHDFGLARSYFPDPEETIRRWSESVSEAIAELASKPPTQAPRREAEIHNYAARVRELLEIVRGVGELEEEARLRLLAIGNLEPPSLREEVRSALTEPRGES